MDGKEKYILWMKKIIRVVQKYIDYFVEQLILATYFWAINACECNLTLQIKRNI